MSGQAGKIAPAAKECPFCACTMIKYNDDGENEWLECDYCGATGPYSPEDAAANLTIEQAWDKRPKQSNYPRETAS